ncbi:MAG: glucose 1-dehydrogenase [Dehalococcoidia bacterium]|nr:MAG: glucose 1-dehydrogenase [Dehalococcoidia bacterium]
MGKLDGKVALITGAASGIGRATALLFAKEEAKIAVADYVPAGGQETVKMIQKAGGDAVFIEADVSQAANVERMVKTTVNAYGQIDILFNNAGVGQTGDSMVETTEDEWDRVLNINLKGVFLCSKYAIPVMLDQGGGVIINTASIAGLVGLPGIPAYGVSKAGVIQLTRMMAAEYGRQDIRVNCICPGAIQTPMTESVSLPMDAYIQVQFLNRTGQPEDIARAALYLASDDSSFVTGVALVVDGGWTVSPRMPRPGAG